jgi:hypothetical protein
MEIAQFLDELRKLNGVTVEERIMPNGTHVYIIVRLLPEVPYGTNRHVWYPLVVSPDKTKIYQSEKNAVLRHIRHAESHLFKP